MCRACDPGCSVRVLCEGVRRVAGVLCAVCVAFVAVGIVGVCWHWRFLCVDIGCCAVVLVVVRGCVLLRVFICVFVISTCCFSYVRVACSFSCSTCFV